MAVIGRVGFGCAADNADLTAQLLPPVLAVSGHDSSEASPLPPMRTVAATAAPHSGLNSYTPPNSGPDDDSWVPPGDRGGVRLRSAGSTAKKLPSPGLERSEDVAAESPAAASGVAVAGLVGDALGVSLPSAVTHMPRRRGGTWLEQSAWCAHALRRLLLRRRRSANASCSLVFPGHDVARLRGIVPENHREIQAIQNMYEDALRSWQLRCDPPNAETNVIRNQRYTLLSFLPLTLWNQFRYFFNVFYLVVGMSQLFPQFQIGPLFTYLAPLAFVICMSLAKEAIDDIKRWRRDREINGQLYEIVSLNPTSRGELQTTQIPASRLRVGHIIKLHKGQRVPCDVVLLKTLAAESDGTTFIRTDQLDGETDWKLRRAVRCTQNAPVKDWYKLNAVLSVEPPRKEIYEFCGAWHHALQGIAAFGDMDASEGDMREALGLEHTMWTNSVVTAGPILVLSVFTGKETRAALHTTEIPTKMGVFDLEVNRMSKFLCVVLLIFALFLTNGKPLGPMSLIYFIRYVLLLSSIIPISLRVNLDMAKIVYSYIIMRDRDIPGTVVRNSTLPEELGRVDVLFSDKTGTITRNNMVLQKLAVGGKMFQVTAGRSMDQLKKELSAAISATGESPQLLDDNSSKRKDAALRLRRIVAGIATCHSVVPVKDELASDRLCFQASSPDEMALVTFAARSLGVCLVARSESQMTLSIDLAHSGNPQKAEFQILEVFPFTSARRRMGIILREESSGQIWYIVKGAETAVMPHLIARPQWLVEELDGFARSGLRTLVFAMQPLSDELFAKFQIEHTWAKTVLVDREARCSAVVERYLEKDLELLGVTGVEDELQLDVAETIETLGQAGIRVWMLTGDKTETALCIATSAGLKGRHDNVATVVSSQYPTPADVSTALQNMEGTGAVLGRTVLASRRGARTFGLDQDQGAGLVLCVDGVVIDWVMADRVLAELFVAVTQRSAKAVLCSRCSPSQKSQIVNLVKQAAPQLRLAAVGDGGNDVPMIQAAHCGIGIVGVEGKQASLASDFSIMEFRHLKQLLLWHGRLAHQRSAKLSGFVVHRGLVISAIQVIFSAIFYFTPLALFQGWLQVGYATYYTMLPVFSLVLDVDIPESVAFLFPELYQSQKTEGGLSDKAFFKTLFKSIYQGAVIMLGVLALFERQMTNLVAIAFTSLILAELLNVCSEIVTWHPLMILAEVLTVIIYSVSLVMLGDYFDLKTIISTDFWSKVGVITLASWLPVHSFKAIRRALNPPRYAKLLTV